MYLLDTDVPENTDEHKLITRRLYGGDKVTRMLQELILGIGGIRAIQSLHIHPSIYHLNEGHSAFGIFEIANHYMKEYNMSFEEAYEYSGNKIVFTNHTLVAAGNEIFSQELLREYLGTYTNQLNLPIEYVLEKGKVEGKPDLFSMSNLALNMAYKVNAVSKLHAKMAKEVWPDHEMIGITNGIHLPTWVSADIKAQAPYNQEDVKNLSNQMIWRTHEMAKYRLLDEVEYRTGKRLNKDQIIITWARRFASYKRPELLFTDVDRLKDIIFSASKPVQFLMAGKAHPKDELGHQSIKRIIQLIKEHGLEKHFIFVPNYNIKLADALVAGSDLWLNTPKRGQEASGTSGMKAAANGILQCSVSDGWVDEINLKEYGWELNNEKTAEHIYDLLEKEILPLYYERNEEGIPSKWVDLMKQNIIMAWSDFSSRRMVKEYIDVLYRPTLELESKEKHYHNWRKRYRTKHVS